MKISVIAIGDELLIGQVTDSNSGFIARTIAPFGWELSGVQVVGDNREAILQAIERGHEMADVVITTGGLGPTKDDITKEVLRSRFGGEMVEDAEVLENVKAVFERRGLKLNELTLGQAIVPSSARIIQNRVGTAPIMRFEGETGKILIAMPGVPSETEHMFATEVWPQLLQRFQSDICVVHHTLIVEGISESKLAMELNDWEDNLDARLHLAYLPMGGYLRLRLDGHDSDKARIEMLMDKAVADLKALCGSHLLYDGDKTPAEILLEKLGEKGLSVSTAESCTGGNVAHRLTEIPGASAVVMGGIVAYSNDVKQRVLGVKAETLDAHGAVSLETVEEMAQGACRATGSDIAMATSGIAGPGGGSAEKPVGTVCIAVAMPQGVESKVWHFAGNRHQVIERATNAAIVMAIKSL